MSVAAVAVAGRPAPSLQRGEHEPAGRRARASGWRAHRSTSSARPAMMPACGPPSSLSPLNVTSAAPAASVCRAAGSSASHAGGGPASHGHVGVDQAAAEVDDDGDAERRQLGDRRVLDEALDPVVARVHLEHQRRRRRRPGRSPAR